MSWTRRRQRRGKKRGGERDWERGGERGKLQRACPAKAVIKFRFLLHFCESRRAAEHEKTAAFTSPSPSPSLLLCCFLLVAPFPCAFFHGFRFCDVVPRARKLQAHNKYFVLRFLSSFLLLSFSLSLLFLKYLLQIFACFLLFLNLHSYFFTLLCLRLLFFFFFFFFSSLLPCLSSSSCFSFCKYCVAYLHKVLRECFL